MLVMGWVKAMPDINVLLSAATESTMSLVAMLLVRSRAPSTAVVEELANILAEHDTVRPRNPMLKDLPRVVEMALKRRDADSIIALSDLGCHILGDVLFVNLLQNMAVAVGGDISSGLNLLDRTFSGLRAPGSGKASWKQSLYVATQLLVGVNFYPTMVDFIYSWCTDHVYHIELLLQELYFDSIMQNEMGIQINKVDWEAVLQVLYGEEVNLGREVREIVKDEKGDSYCPFTLSRLEPRVLFLSECLRQAIENQMYQVRRNTVTINLSSGELLKDVYERLRQYPRIQRAVELFEELRREFAKTKVSVDHKDYLIWKNNTPYATFFIGDLEKLKAGLKSVALPCMTALYYPYAYANRPSSDAKSSSDSNKALQVVVEGKTSATLDFARALIRQVHLTAPYARLLLDCVYALRLIEEGEFSKDDATKEILERASTANFYPFLSPGFMVRRMSLFIAAQFLKFVNALAEIAEHRKLIFEPTGDFQTDIKYWWRKSSLDFKIGFMQDADEFLKHINPQSYLDLLDVLNRPHFELVPKVTEWSINPLGWGL